MTFFVFLRCVSFAGVAYAYAPCYIAEADGVHDANIAIFVQMWKDCVDPAGAGASAAPRLSLGGLDNTLPD